MFSSKNMESAIKIKELVANNSDSVIRAAGIHSNQQQHDKQTRLLQNKAKLIKNIRDSVIGGHTEYVFRTVYGEKALFYADYTASGKSLSFIENYI